MATETDRIRQEVATLVQAAMGRAEISKLHLSDLTGIPYSTLGRKLLGRTDFTFEELFLIAEATGSHPASFVPTAFAKAVA